MKWEDVALGDLNLAVVMLIETLHFPPILTKAPQKNLLCCPHPTDRKMRKNRVVFFFFFFFFIEKCQIWAKNLLKFLFNGLKEHLYMRFDCIPPEFSPFRNFKKNIGKLNSLTVRKKKKNRPTDPIFKFCACEGNITIFFFGLTQ